MDAEECSLYHSVDHKIVNRSRFIVPKMQSQAGAFAPCSGRNALRIQVGCDGGTLAVGGWRGLSQYLLTVAPPRE